MTKMLSIENFLTLVDELPVVDVRSPAEYFQGHIPNAVNIALFGNEERKQVGIRYKLGGKENAVQLGLEIVGSKLCDFVKQAKKLAPKKKILLHCWRGGMRSNSMAWLFETAGMQTSALEGGYKAYRKFIRKNFSHDVKLIVLGGYTGSGKTDILKELQNMGEQVLDIEAIAHHKGSVFGPLGQEKQPTNEQFENNLADIWQQFNFDKNVFVEDESRQIGKCGIPDTLFEQMRCSPLVKIIVPKSERIKRLVKEYGQFDKTLLSEQLIKIKERLGGLQTKEALQALDTGDVAKVADICLQYYDKAYQRSSLSHNTEKVFRIEMPDDNPQQAAHAILKLIDKLKQ